jgi:hypothetical protein
MFKKINFNGQNYRDLDRFDSHDLKREELKFFYQTFDFLELIKKWPEIVGPQMSLVTSPLKIKFDSLFIITKHSVFSQELSFLSEQIKQEIFKCFPELKQIIKKLVFQTQETYFQNSKSNLSSQSQEIEPKLHPQSPAYKKRKQEAERLFSEVSDDELRQVLTSIYIQSF